MKIYKLAENEIQDQVQNQEQDFMGKNEVLGAAQTLNMAIGNINQALGIIEENNIAKLFERESLITEIQSGALPSLDINKIDTALQAMVNISKTIPIINESLRTIQNYDAAAKLLQVDIQNIQNAMIKTIQVGKVGALTQMLPGFQAQVPSMSGTMDTSTIN